jgi:5-methylcytosine-specific restriction endonuclease McrA
MGKQRERKSAHRKAGTWSCHYCDQHFRKHDRKYLTIDHIVPRSMGGPDYAWNRVLCCLECNRKKADSSYEDFTGFDYLPVQCWEFAMTTKEWLRS